MVFNHILQHSNEASELKAFTETTSLNTIELINLNETARVTTMSRTMINRLRSEGRFPAAVALGEKRIAFPRQEVLNWVRDRIAERELAQ